MAEQQRLEQPVENDATVAMAVPDPQGGDAHGQRRTPLRVIAVTRARVATASRSTLRKPMPVPKALMTALQPPKARVRVPSSRASPSIMSAPGRSALAFERTRATTEWPFTKALAHQSAVGFHPLHPKQESSFLNLDLSLMLGIYAVTAF